MIISGCAKTMTPIVSYGDQLVVDVTLRGNVDIVNNRYFLVMSDNGSYNLPLPYPYIIDATPEFIEPEIAPQIGSREAYFTNFFSTWSGYVVVDATGFSLVKSPFVMTAIPSREVLENLGEVSTKLHFSFRLGRLFATVPDYLYFDFVTVPWSNTAPKTPSDHLPSTGNRVSKVLGTDVSISDDSNSSLPASQDILNVRLQVQQ